jgi:hypothetical protein
MVNAKIRPKPLDFVAVLIGIAVVVIVSVAAYQRPTRGKELHITSAEGSWIYPLTEERVIEVNGPLGVTTVVIEDESVRVLDSPCPHKHCIQRGAITSPGHWNACLPNRVFLKIEGKSIAPKGTEVEPIDAHSH